MGKPNKKRRRMNTRGESVNRGDGKSTSDDAKVGSATTSKVKIPEAPYIADIRTDDFKIVKAALTFVDKSKYIKNFFDLHQTVVGITAPRRFMKTTFMNMLKNFLEITLDEKDKNGKPISDPKDGENYKMFMGLQLGVEHPEFVGEHCGKYPTIFMSLRDVGGESKKAILDSLKIALCGAFEQHSYLVETAADGSKSLKNKELDGDAFLEYFIKARQKDLFETDVKGGLEFLSEILHRHYKKKVVVLIDDADGPIMTAIRENMDNQLLKYMIDLISTLLTRCLKDNEHLERALLNSSVRLPPVHSAVYSNELNNLYDVLFLQNSYFSSVYGFTADEVRDLLNKEEFQAVKDSEGVKKWYDGYQTLTNEETRIYNSWSIINYLINSVSIQKKMFDIYWPHSGLVDILGKLFVKPEIQKLVEKLLEGEYIKIRSTHPTTEKVLELKNTIYDSQSALTQDKVNFFLQLLWDDALLNAVEKIREIVTLMIPNWEIKRIIQSKCYTESLFRTKYNLNPANIQRYIEALKNLLEMASDEEQTEDSIKNTFQELCDAIAGLFSDGAIIPDNESEFHHIFFYLVYSNTTFTAQANRAAAVMKASEEVEPNTTHEKEAPQRKAKASTSTKPNETRGVKNELDMLVILGIVAAIFEIKYCKKNESEKSKAALKQIFDKGYFSVFDKDECKHVKTKIYIGLDFNCFESDIKVTMSYLVNSTDLDTAKFVSNTFKK